MNKIIEYIKQNYKPISIIVYGSYADGTNNLNSDFDALVISSGHKEFHDTSFVNGIQLDVFVYPESIFSADYNLDDFVQIMDGQIIMDTENKGALLKKQVLTYITTKQNKTDDEIKASIDWCLKMFARTHRGDIEGIFRWHWVLIDSLEIFCDVVHHPYLGPKKTLKWMERNHPSAFNLYQKALFEFCEDSLSNWIQFLANMH